VPTVAEQGFPGFEMTQWYGLNAPASMSPAAIDKLAAAAAKAVSDSGFACVTSTSLQGQSALRLCTINPLTTEADIAETLRRLAAARPG